LVSHNRIPGWLGEKAYKSCARNRRKYIPFIHPPRVRIYENHVKKP
jgi:hypothetical protein